MIEDNGAGSGEKILVCINPPIVDEVQGLRRSNALEAESAMLWLLQKGVRTTPFPDHAFK